MQQSSLRIAVKKEALRTTNVLVLAALQIPNVNQANASVRESSGETHAVTQKIVPPHPSATMADATVFNANMGFSASLTLAIRANACPTNAIQVLLIMIRDARGHHAHKIHSANPVSVINISAQLREIARPI